MKTIQSGHSWTYSTCAMGLPTVGCEAPSGRLCCSLWCKHRVKLMFLCLQRGAQKDPLRRVPGARSAGGDEMTDTLQS